MRELIKLKLSGRKVEGFDRIRGLMFRKSKKPLIFEFEKDVKVSIHSLFVFFPFKVIWFDKNDNVVEERIVKPFRFYVKPKKPFRSFIEIPIY